MSHRIAPVNPFTAVAREIDEFPASVAQLGYVVSLLDERAWESMENPKYVDRCAALATLIPAFLTSTTKNYETDCPMTRSGASTLIEGLKTLDRKTVKVEWQKKDGDVVEVKWPAVPAGHYAIEWDDNGGSLAFFRVDRPTEGKWSGYVFVKRLVGVDEVRISRAMSDTALEIIGADPKAAAVRYGKEIGRCSICNRRLTNETSREAGIGPQCAAKF